MLTVRGNVLLRLHTGSAPRTDPSYITDLSTSTIYATMYETLRSDIKNDVTALFRLS